ncbi:phosphotransferase [Streptomyces sp. NPDC007164]|uniref:phosphotransferase n=1 Tax=Streptomyces sp. NPDC007164 TaxID=3156918 RepID=UPI0033F555EB
MTEANVAGRAHLPADDLAELIRAYGLNEVLNRHHLADDLMNVNWRLDTRTVRFALKRATDVPLNRLRRTLAVLPLLASYGVPVCTPLLTAHGDVIAEVRGGAYCLFPWSAGEHMHGTDLSLTQTFKLGTHLAELHTALGRAADETGMPAVPASVTAEVTEAGLAVRKADRLAGAVLAQGAGDAFDRAAGTALAERKVLLDKHAHLRPERGIPAGPHGWTHGDFQYLH